MTTDTPAPDALCARCGHPKSDHLDFIERDCECLHENDADKTTGNLFCECNSFVSSLQPSPDHEYNGTTNVKRDDWVNPFPVSREPIPAHDTPTAKLREQLAQAQRERDTARAEVESLKSEIDMRRKERAEILNVKSADGLTSSEWLARTAQAEAEAASLRAQLAAVHTVAQRYQDESASFHTLADGYAGAMAEAAELRHALDIVKANLP